MIAAIQLMEEDKFLIPKLRSKVSFFKKNLLQMGCKLGNSDTPIQPMFIKKIDQLMNLCLLLHHQGVLVNPIVFPVVPKKKSRIRLSITAGLSKSQQEYSLEQFARFGKELQLI